VVIGSATAPVMEVIEDGVNGLLVEYFDGEALATTIAAVLADPAGHRPLGEAARALVMERYDLGRVCLPAQLELVDAVARGELPA
jgi:glycosyltransferase involved in cell wall biosynthesis